MESLLHNLRFAARSLARARGFSTAAIASLALGIGLTTAVFTIADTLLLRKLPVREQERVVVVAGITRDGKTTNFPLDVSAAQDFVRQSRSLAAAAFYTYEGATPKPMTRGGDITSLRRALVSGDYFTVLGASPVIGRALQPDDDVPGAARVMVLSHRGWTERFGRDPNVVGRRVDLYDEGVSYTVVGVMPQGLDFPRGVDAWATVRATVAAANIPYISLNIVARLAAGATPSAAAEEMTRYWQRDGAPAFQRELRGGATPLADLVIGNTRSAVVAFSVAAMLVLLITCVNVANLLLVRGLSRAREHAVRMALGATRGRVLAQMFSEHVLLALGGGVLALAVAFISLRVFVNFAPAELPRLDEIALTGNSIAMLAMLTALALLLVTLVPVFSTGSITDSTTLRSGARQTTPRTTRLVSETLVVSQVAIALLVMSAAMLVGRSFIKLQNADLSFDAAPLVVAELTLRADQYNGAPKQLAMLQELLPAVSALPGVVAAAPVVALPFSAVGWDATPSAEGQTAEQLAANPLLNMELASPDYFRVMSLKILEGRAFGPADRDGAVPVVMLSESAARAYWPEQSVVGKQIYLGGNASRRTFSVVGVVPDTRYRDLRTARPSIYFPLAQSFFPFAPTTLVLRTNTSVGVIAPALRAAVGEHAPGVAVTRVTPFSTLLDAPLAQPRLNALLLLVFAGAAVLLASIGLFGVMATMVQQRRREFGVRQALGATAADVGRMVLRRGLAIAAIGSAAGLLAAIVFNRLLGALLFGVSPTDATALALTALLLLAVAALASLLPARQGARVSPLEAMRAE